MLAVSESILRERTVLEVELKGVCEPYDVVIQPSILIIPGQIAQDTVVRRKFKVLIIIILIIFIFL